MPQFALKHLSAKAANGISTATKIVLVATQAVAQEKFGARAVFVANDTIFGLTRIFTTLTSGYIPMEVFRDQTKAKAWLDRRHSAGQNDNP